MAGFDAERLRLVLSEIGNSYFPHIVVFEEIDSTSSELLRRLSAGAEVGTVVVADSQTSGRGRMGRTWHSPPGNLYISVSLSVPSPVAENLPLIPLAAGVAAWESLFASGISGVELKWPNDLLTNGLKVGGILCETQNPNARPVVVVAGMGINLRSTAFPSELVGKACDVSAIHRKIESETVAAMWMDCLCRWVSRLGLGEARSLVKEWLSRAEPFGKKVRIDGVECRTVGLTETGRLIVSDNDGTEKTIEGGVVEDVGQASQSNTKKKFISQP